MNTQTQTLRIRTAHLHDLNALSLLFAQLIEDVNPDIADMENVLFDICHNPYNCVFVVEYEQKIIGTAQVIIYENLIRTPYRKAIIDSVIVDTQMRGMNIGKQLIGHIIAYCKTQQVSKINLVSSYRRYQAYDFYKSMGFKDVGLGFELALV